ncbi:hypothetical protein HED22_16965 [Thalassospira sp. HF15]|uniref:hypothetical protein n=1 Tax=Thalassospira sp. HF15 TaxID=2722755 RepID=UPI001431DDE4|nr:hypothetical protein [Thalassospira sp. HF15]NIY77347.1 hypothetical protein [Thalassospira sp. HF15]
MSTIFGLGNGLPMSTRASSVERSGAHEGIEGFSAGSAAPVSSVAAIGSESGSSKSQLSDAVQSVMLEFQDIGSGSSSFAAAMDAVKANDRANGINTGDDVVSSNSDPAKDDPALAEQDAEEEFKSALRDSLSPPTKDEKHNEKAEIEKRQERQKIDDAAQQSATDLPENVAGLDSRVAAQVMSGQPARQQPALAA